VSSEIELPTLEEEKDEKIRRYAQERNVVMLCLIAPFAPLRVAPRREITAHFSYPEEFMIEEFINIIEEKYPDIQERPQLYLLIHSPGGAAESAYVIAKCLRHKFSDITAFIPHIAASGATEVAISSNRIIMGDISRLSPIDPHGNIDGETVYYLSIVRAFRNLEEYFSTRAVEETPYPYQHLLKTITAERYDRAVHALRMVEGYARDLLKKAGYSDNEIDKIVKSLVYRFNIHEEIIMIEKAREIGLKVIHFKEDEHYREIWSCMKYWLQKYLYLPSPTHIIRYVLPEE